MSQIVSAQVSGYLSGVELSPRDLRRVPAMTELLDSAVAEFSGVLRALGVDKLRRDRGSCPLCGGGRRRKDCFSADLDRGLWICHRCGRSGGVLDLVEAVLATNRRGAVGWLRDHLGLPQRTWTAAEKRAWAERRRRAERRARDLADWRWRVIHALRARRNDLWDTERRAASWARSHLNDSAAAADPRWELAWEHALDDQRGDLVERLLKLIEAAPAETLARLRRHLALADISTAPLAELNALRTTLEEEYGT